MFVSFPTTTFNLQIDYALHSCLYGVGLCRHFTLCLSESHSLSRTVCKSPGYTKHCMTSPGYTKHCVTSPGYTKHCVTFPGYTKHCVTSPGYTKHCVTFPGYTKHCVTSPGYTKHCMTSPGYTKHWHLQATQNTVWHLQAYIKHCMTSAGYTKHCMTSAGLHKTLYDICRLHKALYDIEPEKRGFRWSPLLFLSVLDSFPLQPLQPGRGGPLFGTDDDNTDLWQVERNILLLNVLIVRAILRWICVLFLVYECYCCIEV